MTSTQDAKTTILVIDDDESQRRMLTRLLRKEGHDVVTAPNGSDALDLLKSCPVDFVFTDLEMPKLDGLGFLREAKKLKPDLPIVLVTGFGSMESAIGALRMGALDYIQKPVEPEYLIHRLNQMLEHSLLQREHAKLKRLLAENKNSNLLGHSESMKDVFDLIARVARNDVTVLVHGETGTGKELVAREIYKRGTRSNHPFVAINCGALSEQLLESELFGHNKGAFTGAGAKKIGLFEAADGGTIFLDEVGEMSSALQTGLLRVLQEREVLPVGATRPIPIDVRIIAATNRDLLKEVEEGTFRMDLFYRLNVVTIDIPPLRKRPEDIPLLTVHFFEECADRFHTRARGFEPDALNKLASYDWPGNVRQLQNVVTRAAALNDGEMLGLDALPQSISKLQTITYDLEESFVTLYEMERRYIERVLERTLGNKSDAATILGIDRSTLYRKCKQYELP